ncbi:MAG: FAD-dependent oxidoreductase [Coriobacteriales bacterium]|nr:FAD-dependent oxidoreductase [Coriobacteriales bacterium]
MIEVSGIRVPLAHLDGDDRHELGTVRTTTLRKLHLTPHDVASFELRRRSVDARKKSDILMTYTARLELTGHANAERQLLARLERKHASRGVNHVDEHPFSLPSARNKSLDLRPIVVGAGCAGLFCALALAQAGLAPLLVERGDDATRRTAAVDHFNKTGALDPESNIQFGLGGAGTFSDGKLSTGTKSAAHRMILEALVEGGAARDILWDAKPHVGSDVLPQVVTNLVRRIEAAGGEVRCRTRLVGIDVSNGAVHSVTLESRDPSTGFIREEHVATNHVVLATGHSARDVFELLKSAGVSLERKTFAMGVRIEHLQTTIDRAQYGNAAGHPALGAAPYKLAHHLDDGRGAFSFCMCPGGFVVAAASEPGGVVTNGMSLSDRAGSNANSGLLANVFPTDLPGDDVLAGVQLQRSCEQSAFAAGGGDFIAPAQLLGDFLQGVPSSGPGAIQPTYPRGVTWGSIESCLPNYVTETLRVAVPRMERQLKGFSSADAVLTGVESRSSSPVRVTRDETGQALGIRGLFPCGEGAGYAGGIMSAATDGIRAAGWLIDSL